MSSVLDLSAADCALWYQKHNAYEAADSQHGRAIAFLDLAVYTLEKMGPKALRLFVEQEVVGEKAQLVAVASIVKIVLNKVAAK